jgi:hypothetical protein
VEEYRLRAFGNRVLRRIPGPKGEKVLVYSTNIIRMNKLRKMRGEGM